MDLRNYGVIDFAEHVKLPTGDADDLHDLTYKNVEVGRLFSNGDKEKQIDALTAELAKKEKELAKKKEELAKKEEELTDAQSDLSNSQELFLEYKAKYGNEETNNKKLTKSADALMRLSEQNAATIDRLTKINLPGLVQQLAKLPGIIAQNEQNIIHEELKDVVHEPSKQPANNKNKKKEVRFKQRRKLP